MTTRERLHGIAGTERACEAILRLAQRTSSVDPEVGQIQSVLLYGPAKSTQVELADILAQAWLCTNPGLDGACGLCQSCHAALNRRHADQLKIEPQPPSHIIRLSAISAVGSGAGELSVQEFLRTYPMMGKNKVVLVFDADRMNADAANAFLKTLEEPPERARILLTAPAPSRVLPTILSRCLAIACELPSQSTFAETSAEWGELAIFLEGSPDRAKSLKGLEEIYRGVLRLAGKLETATPSMALQISEGLRELSEALDKKTSQGMRASQAEILAAFALALRSFESGSGQAMQALPRVIEAHRRILGNGSATLIFDALASSLTAK